MIGRLLRCASSTMHHGIDFVVAPRRRPGLARAGSGATFAALAALAAFGMLATLAETARAGIAFGLRGGYEDVETDAFAGSGPVGGTPFFGLQASFPIVPFASLVLAGEQRTKQLDFDGASWAGQELGGRATWTDQTLLAALRVGLPGVVRLYGGGGVGMHRQEADLSEVVTLTGGGKESAAPGDRSGRARGSHRTADSDPLGEFVDQAEAETVNVSWHALVGLELHVPVAPLSVFAEGRLDDLQNRPPHSLAAYAGVNLRLP